MSRVEIVHKVEAPKDPPAEVILHSAVRLAGVMIVTVSCSCGNTFSYHTDSDYVTCPNCGTTGRYRGEEGNWRDPHVFKHSWLRPLSATENEDG